MTATALKWGRPAQPSVEALRTATLWKTGFLVHVGKEVERLRSDIEYAKSIGVVPAESLHRDFQDSLTYQTFLSGTPTGSVLVEMFSQLLRDQPEGTLKFVEDGIRVEEEELQAVRRRLKAHSFTKAHGA